MEVTGQQCGNMINPYLPCNEFIPDGEPYVFHHRVYIFGSHDLYHEKALCAGDYVCWSAAEDNLCDWTYEGTIYQRTQDPFVKKMVESGKNNAFNQYLYAPDVVEIGGKYYLYYGVALAGSGIGVAVADSPVGPYTYLGRVRYPEEAKPQGWKDTEDGIADGDMALGKGIPMLQLNPLKKHFGYHTENYPYDPAVLYDEGRLFLYYGSGSCQAVELSVQDKRTILKNAQTGTYVVEHLLPTTSRKEDKSRICAQDGWFMANGSSIRKIGSTYYLSYYARNKKYGHAMCYSTAESPFGPFVYCGVLISLGNGGYKKQRQTAYGGNTHGGMVQINGRWYQNYHRQTGAAATARQACMAELVMNPDGTFQQAEFKSQVMAEGGLPLNYTWPAYMACVFTNSNGVTGTHKNSPFLKLKEYAYGIEDAESGKRVYQVVTGLTEGCIVGFKYMDFGESNGRLAEVCVTMRNTWKGHVDIFAGGVQPENKLLCMTIPECLQSVVKCSGKFKSPNGRQPLYFRFYGQSKHSDFLTFNIC